MKMINIIRDYAISYEKKKNTLFSYDVKKQKAYLRSFSFPKNDTERSFYQYKCQMKTHSALNKLIINLGSLIMLGTLFFKIKNSVPKKTSEFFDSVFILDGKPANILPAEVINDYKSIKYYERDSNNLRLSKDDKKFIMQIWKQYPMAWHFILKVLIKVAMYSYISDKYKPKAIIVCAEYSFTSSILTAYCEENNLKHTNIMHGEKLFYIRDSFFRFHECYVWNEYYKNLFLELRAEKSQLTISLPVSMKIKEEALIEKSIDFTYYLANENDKTLKKIAGFLIKLSEEKFKIVVRPHPRYSDMNKINILFGKITVENNKEMTIEESLLRTRNAISLYSTVLSQAYLSGINVVIDDLSNPRYYDKLSVLKYINFTRSHILLSELIRKEI